MHDSDEVTVWLREVCNRSSIGMDQVWNAYYEKLVQYARRKLGDLPRRDADDEDIALTLRKIAILRLEGYNNEEIAAKLGIAIRSVERKLNRIRGIWSHR